MHEKLGIRRSVFRGPVNESEIDMEEETASTPETADSTPETADSGRSSRETQLEADLEGIRSDLKTAVDYGQLLADRVRSLEADKKQLESLLSRAQDDLSQNRADKTNSQLLTEDLGSAKQRISHLEKELTSSTTDVSNSKDSEKRLLSEMGSLSAKIENLEDDKKEQAEEISRLEERAKELEEELRLAHNKDTPELDNLIREKQSLEDQVAKLKAAEKELKAAMTSKEGELAQRDEQVTTLETSVDELRSELQDRDNHIASLRAKVIDLTSQVQDSTVSEDELAGIEQEMSNLRQRLEEHEQTIESLSSDLQDTQLERDGSKEMQSLLNEEMEVERSRGERLREENSRLHDTVAELESRLSVSEQQSLERTSRLKDEFRMTLTHMRSGLEVDQIKESGAEFRAAIDRCHVGIKKALDSKDDSVEEKNENLRSIIHSMEDDLERVMSQYAKCQEMLMEIFEDNQQKAGEVAALRDELECSKADNETNMKLLTEMQTELDRHGLGSTSTLHSGTSSPVKPIQRSFVDSSGQLKTPQLVIESDGDSDGDAEHQEVTASRERSLSFSSPVMGDDDPYEKIRQCKLEMRDMKAFMKEQKEEIEALRSDVETLCLERVETDSKASSPSSGLSPYSDRLFNQRVEKEVQVKINEMKRLYERKLRILQRQLAIQSRSLSVLSDED